MCVSERAVERAHLHSALHGYRYVSMVMCKTNSIRFDKDVILDVVTSIGLDPDDARSVIEERRFKKDVDEDWEKSHQYGITGVPTFVIAGKGLVGAQSYEALARLVEEAGAKKR